MPASGWADANGGAARVNSVSAAAARTVAPGTVTDCNPTNQSPVASLSRLGGGCMAIFASLEWYAEVSQTINQIYREELGRDADFGGWANWLHHAREGGKDADWIRARIRESEEWHAIHDAPPLVTMPRLVPAGAVFRLDTGARVTAVECTD